MEKNLQRLNEIKKELHDIANDFAINKQGIIGVALHQAANELDRPLRMITEGATEEDRQENMDRWLAGQIAKFGPLTSL